MKRNIKRTYLEKKKEEIGEERRTCELLSDTKVPDTKSRTEEGTLINQSEENNQPLRNCF